MNDACEQDFRFGWRWLLPIRDDDRVALSGFREDEQTFWRLVLTPNGLADAAHAATIWIINTDHDEGVRGDDIPDFSHLNVVCVVGSNKVVSKWRKAMSMHFPVLREYGLLPADNPRVVVPLNLPRYVAAALQLHRPGRRLARCALLAARVMVSIGRFGLLRGRVLCIAVRDETCLPMGAESAGLATRLPEMRGVFALYLGTPGRNRKTVILPVNDSPQVVLKMAESPDARHALENELSALRTLAASLLAPNVPAVLDVVECGDTLTLYQEYRQRRSVRGTRYREAVVDFLAILSTQNLRRQPLGSILSVGWGEFGAWKSRRNRRLFSAVVRGLEQAAAEGMMLCVHRTHGDFAPWNCAWTKQGLFVFDWENSREYEPTFGDAFYFVVAPAVLISQRADPARVARQAMGLAAEVASKAGFPVEGLRIYWALWLLERAAKGNQPLYGRLLKELERQWRCATD